MGVSKPITGILSVAALFTLKVEDNRRQLLDPATQGAITMLEAIIDLSQDPRPGHVYSEEDWNPMTCAEVANADAVSAYCALKALAEKAI